MYTNKDIMQTINTKRCPNVLGGIAPCCAGCGTSHSYKHLHSASQKTDDDKITLFIQCFSNLC